MLAALPSLYAATGRWATTVQRDTVTPFQGGGFGESIPHTCSGTQRLLLAFIMCSSGTPLVGAPTYGGVELATLYAGEGCYVGVLQNPAAGENFFSFTPSFGCQYVVRLVSYTNVGSYTGFAQEQIAAYMASTTRATAPGDLVVACDFRRDIDHQASIGERARTAGFTKEDQDAVTVMDQPADGLWTTVRLQRVGGGFFWTARLAALVLRTAATPPELPRLVAGGFIDSGGHFVDVIRGRTFAPEADILRGTTASDGGDRFYARADMTQAPGERINIGHLPFFASYTWAVRFRHREHGSTSLYQVYASRGDLYGTDCQGALGFRDSFNGGTPFFYGRNGSTLVGAEDGQMDWRNTLVDGQVYTLVGRWQAGTQQVWLCAPNIGGAGIHRVARVTSASGNGTDGGQPMYLLGPSAFTSQGASAQTDLLGALVYDEYVSDTTLDAIAENFWGQLAPTGAPATPTVDAVSGGNAAAPSVTWSHTVGADADVLYVWVQHNRLDLLEDVPSVTRGAQQFEKLGATVTQGQSRLSLWKLAAPTPGPADIVTGSLIVGANIRAVSVSLRGVDLTAPEGGIVATFGTSRASTALKANQRLLAAFGYFDADGPFSQVVTPGAAQTLLRDEQAVFGTTGLAVSTQTGRDGVAATFSYNNTAEATSLLTLIVNGVAEAGDDPAIAGVLFPILLRLTGHGG